jgi:hypothetical protein
MEDKERCLQGGGGWAQVVLLSGAQTRCGLSCILIGFELQRYFLQGNIALESLLWSDAKAKVVYFGACFGFI